jgi:hypothetical protein
MMRLRIFWLQFRADWLAGSIADLLRTVRELSRERERTLARIEELRQRQDRARTRRVIAEAIARRPLS